MYSFRKYTKILKGSQGHQGQNGAAYPKARMKKAPANLAQGFSLISKKSLHDSVRATPITPSKKFTQHAY